jgi:hypothetical protein
MCGSFFFHASSGAAITGVPQHLERHALVLFCSDIELIALANSTNNPN